MTLLEETPRGDRTCPVCAARNNSPIYPEAQDPITWDRFQIVKCSLCGLAYTVPRPSVMDRYYPPKYRAYGPVAQSVLSALYRMRVARWALLKPAGGTVLEVGCGPGLMLAAFRRRGWQVLGIERSREAVEAAKAVSGVKIVATPVHALPPDARFDLIVMFQVLEHIAEPVALLRECASRLAPGGFLIVNVPNFASWQARFGGSKWLHLDPPRHLSHFTPQTLSGTLQRAGLQLVQLTFASPEHDPYGWVESTISRVTGRANRLTRLLTGLDPLGPAGLLFFLLGGVLALPALLLAAASWPAKNGALMEGIATRSSPAER